MWRTSALGSSPNRLTVKIEHHLCSVVHQGDVIPAVGLQNILSPNTTVGITQEHTAIEPTARHKNSVFSALGFRNQADPRAKLVGSEPALKRYAALRKL